MTKLEKMSKAQLIDEIRRLQAAAGANLASGEALLLPDRELETAQQQQDESHDRNSELYNASPVAYMTLDKNGRLLEINLTGASMLGLARADVLGKLFSSYVVDADRRIFQSYLRRAFLATGNIVAEVKIISADGAPREVHLENLIVRQRTGGQRSGCHMVMTDITAHKLAVSALDDYRYVLDALTNAIPATVFFKDKALRYILVNQDFCEVAGLTAEQIIGKTDAELFPPAVARNFQHSDYEVLKSGEAITGLEQRYSDWQRRQHWRSTSKAPFRDQSGQINGVVGVSMDVAKARGIEQRNTELLQQNRWLTRRMFSVQERERRLIARELHDELGQWLTAIQAEALAIASSGEVAPDSRIHAAIIAINDSANQVYHVLHRIVDSLRPCALDALGLVDSLRDLAAHWRKSHPGMACELDVEGSFDDMAEFQRITVYRVAQEALTNVAKHAQASHVRICLRRIPKKRGIASDCLQMSVQDDGKGIDASMRKRKRKGLGVLGMRERVIAAGGECNVSSTERGTRVDVTLPLSERRKRER